MQANQPRVIHRSDPARIRIEWADGGESTFSAAELRGLCPCAMCVSESTGARTHDPASVPADLTHEDVRLVGNYAIALRFSDGHATGIYSFRYLRESAPRR
jgi:ATP-binding protein involved in chromosome partitioning